MAAPFAFIPRVVAKHAKPWPGISRPSPSPSPTADPNTELEDTDDDADSISASSSHDQARGKKKAAHSKQSTISQDIAALISLALSDYNIWSDADLRWKLDACLNDETSPEEAGFVPINYLLRRAPFRESLPLSDGQPEPSEAEVVKALRAHTNHTLEVRMRLPSSASVWYGTGKTSRKKDVGGYEVRRKDWLTLRSRPSRGWTRARWDDMTVYMEGIPPQYRTIGGIARFTETLLAPSSAPRVHVQSVSLPPHYLDKPGDAPKCKGYALVTFATKSHPEAILRAWPWKRRRVLIDGDKNMDEEGDRSTSLVVKEAHKYGLRAITKARWNALNEEYLLYKQHLIAQIARTQSEMHHPGESATDAERDAFTCTSTQPEAHTQASTLTTPSSSYPFDCLVFVRNVHPETNKTTLRSLFAQAFQEQDGDEQGRAPDCLDYVDFTKGMDTCYLRLAAPHHATLLMAYFGAQRKVQAHGLDATGRTPVGNEKLITMELIQGKKEELYWDKVPVKVRRQAVEKAVNTQRATAAGSTVPSSAHRNGVHSGSGQQKKRRREA